MKTILVTGASGFIGRAICPTLCSKHRVIALDRHPYSATPNNCISVKADIEDETAIKQICSSYQPDVVIHCAGLAHLDLLRGKQTDRYEKVNSRAAETLAFHAAASNPDMYFVFLSSICVYGEHHDKKPIRETDDCVPTNCYAQSKLSAEKRLVRLFNNNMLKKLDILRLAPVYDTHWSFNLDKRVFSPGKLCYLRFGSGRQKMSALARKNLVEFIAFRLQQEKKGCFCRIMNVCDAQPYSFNEIIKTFQKSPYQPQGGVIGIPLSAIGSITHLAGLVLRHHAVWVDSFYDKLAEDLIFDTGQMRDTGFRPRLNLRSVFLEKGRLS
jgi:nucleoside-diphosphate-sugar epimerase